MTLYFVTSHYGFNVKGARRGIRMKELNLTGGNEESCYSLFSRDNGSSVLSRTAYFWNERQARCSARDLLRTVGTMTIRAPFCRQSTDVIMTDTRISDAVTTCTTGFLPQSSNQTALSVVTLRSSLSQASLSCHLMLAVRGVEYRSHFCLSVLIFVTGEFRIKSQASAVGTL
jgi:hypothetical protein